MPDVGALVPRARPFWEAVDAGFLLGRRWALPVFLLGVLPPLALGLFFGTLLGSLPWMGVLLMWWLRPLGDRLLLGWAGQRYFDDQTPWPRVAAGMLRAFDRSFWADLTWRRFSVTAVFLAPVSFLEQGHNPKRRRWLVGDQGGGLALLAFTAGLVELAVMGMLWTTAVTLFSPGLWGVEEPVENWSFSSLLLVLMFAGAQAAVQPWYVLSCFSLYIAERTRKEGWDLALAFRAARRALKLTALVVVLGAGLLLPPPASAEGFQPHASSGDGWTSIAADPRYGREEPGWKLVPRHPEVARPDVPTLAGLGGAEALRWLAVALGAVTVPTVVVLALMRRRTRLNATPLAPMRSSSPPWKEDVLRLWAAGNTREALSRLYRAALTLAAARGLAVPASATEHECLRVVSSDPEFGPAVSGLVRLWSARAWGGLEPTEEGFQNAVAALERGA